MNVTATAAPPHSLGDAMAARLRETAIVVVGSGVAGALVGGIGSRLAMRIAALAAPEVRGSLTEGGNVVGEITLAGTVGLMLFAGIGSAILGAGAYTVARPWLPRGTAARGLVFGVSLLAFMGSAVIDPANADFVLLGDRLLNVTVFSALFVAFGLVASASIAVLDARMTPASALSPKAWTFTLVGALPVVPGLAGVAMAFAPEFGIPLVGAWLAMLISAPLDRGGRHGSARLLRAAATAVMLMVVGLAGSEYLDAVLTIL